MQPANRRSCPVTSSDVLAVLEDHLLDLGGTVGPTATLKPATPIQYDELRIEHDEGDVKIVIYRSVLSAPQ